MKRFLWSLSLLCCCGGGFGPRDGGPPPCAAGTSGILLLRWTVRGAAPTMAGCQGIDHLTLDFDACGGAGTIDPVPCPLDRFRYDNLPQGPASIVLTALDAAGRPVASGMTTFDLEPDPNARPATLDLR